MVAASHRPVMVCTALLVRIAMGSIMRWKSSHRIAMPSTDDDCARTRQLCQHIQSEPAFTDSRYRIDRVLRTQRKFAGISHES